MNPHTLLSSTADDTISRLLLHLWCPLCSRGVSTLEIVYLHSNAWAHFYTLRLSIRSSRVTSVPLQWLPEATQTKVKQSRDILKSPRHLGKSKLGSRQGWPPTDSSGSSKQRYFSLILEDQPPSKMQRKMKQHGSLAWFVLMCVHVCLHQPSYIMVPAVCKVAGEET